MLVATLKILTLQDVAGGKSMLSIVFDRFYVAFRGTQGGWFTFADGSKGYDRHLPTPPKTGNVERHYEKIDDVVTARLSDKNN